MKILTVCQYYYPEQFKVNEICEALVKQGHEVTVLTGLPNYPSGIVPDEYKKLQKRKEIINGVNVIRCFEVGRGSGKLKLILNYLSYMIFACVKVFTLPKDFDVIYVFQLSPVTMAIPGILYKKLNRKKLFLYCQDLWPESLKALNISETSPIFKLVNKVSRLIYRQCDEIAVTSKSFIQYLVQQHGISEKKIGYHPQHAEELFLSINGEVEQNNQIDFLFAGNIGKVQDIDCILKAVNEIKDIDNFHVHFVGDGSYLETAKNLSKELKVEEKLTFHGRYPIDKMYDFYKMTDAFLLTLQGGNFLSQTVPSKLQGYMAAGKPIFGAIDGAAQEIIKEVNCGKCTNAGDYKELAQLMKHYIENYSSYEEYGVRGHQYFKENFSLDVYLDNLNQSLQKIS